MKNFFLEPSGKIVFGVGSVREYLACFARMYGPNTLLVSGVRSAKENGAYDDVLRGLRAAGKQVVELSGIRAGTDHENVLAGARLAREHHVDLIVGVGGGSVIDCCKAISMAAVYRGDIWADFWARRGVVDFQPLPVGAIPTNLGSGELNGAAVLTHGSDGACRARNYPQCAPCFVLFDPDYTRTLTREQIVSGGFQIFSRALELYLAPPAGESVTNSLLEAIVRNVARTLRKGRSRLQSAETRTDLMWAGALVGNGLFQASKQCRYPCRQAALRMAAETGRQFLECLSVIQMDAYIAACRQHTEAMAGLSVRVWDILSECRSTDELALAGAEAMRALLGELGLPSVGT